MHIVIVGGTGNIGMALARRLSTDHHVRVVARRLPPQREQVLPGIDWYVADVTTDDLEPALAGADVLVHTAWAFHPTRDPNSTWQTNVVGTERVFAAAERVDVSAVVYSSSVAAYSPRADRQPVDETFPSHGAGTSAYAREKAYVERMLDSFELRNPRVRTVRMRPAFAFQREAAAEQWRLFVANPALRRLFDTRLVPLVPMPPNLLVQAVHTSDVADAFVSAIETNTAQGAYNLAADDVLGPSDIGSLLNARTVRIAARRMRSLVSAAWQMHASKAPPDLFETMMNLPVMSTQRARKELGFHPRLSAADAIRSFLDGTAELESGPTAALASDPPAVDGRSSSSKNQPFEALRRN